MADRDKYALREHTRSDRLIFNTCFANALIAIRNPRFILKDNSIQNYDVHAYPAQRPAQDNPKQLPVFVVIFDFFCRTDTGLLYRQPDHWQRKSTVTGPRRYCRSSRYRLRPLQSCRPDRIGRPSIPFEGRLWNLRIGNGNGGVRRIPAETYR